MITNSVFSRLANTVVRGPVTAGMLAAATLAGGCEDKKDSLPSPRRMAEVTVMDTEQAKKEVLELAEIYKNHLGNLGKGSKDEVIENVLGLIQDPKFIEFYTKLDKLGISAKENSVGITISKLLTNKIPSAELKASFEKMEASNVSNFELYDGLKFMLAALNEGAEILTSDLESNFNKTGKL